MRILYTYEVYYTCDEYLIDPITICMQIKALTINMQIMHTICALNLSHVCIFAQRTSTSILLPRTILSRTRQLYHLRQFGHFLLSRITEVSSPETNSNGSPRASEAVSQKVMDARCNEVVQSPGSAGNRPSEVGDARDGWSAAMI